MAHGSDRNRVLLRGLLPWYNQPKGAIFLHRLDCLGDMCPLPLMKLMQYRERLDQGESVMIVTDHSCTCESLLQYCHRQRLPVEVAEPMQGIWEISISPRAAD